MSQDDALKRLKALDIPPASDAARSRALALSLAAFEEAKAQENQENLEAAKKIDGPAQGMGWGERLKSIFSLERKWTMDIRIPIGTAAVVLLLLPLGYQLYSTTALTQLHVDQPETRTVTEPVKDQPVTVETNETAQTETAKTETVQTPQTETAPVQPPVQTVAETPIDTQPVTQPEPSAAADNAMVDAEAPKIAPDAYSSPNMTMRMESVMPAPMAAPYPGTGQMGGMAAPTGTVMTQDLSGDVFEDFDESPLKSVSEAPVSTFSIDVDTASYSYVRRMLEDGYIPQPDAVRIEEMINYFPYDYALPTSADAPFKPTVAIYPTPWNPKTQLLHIGIKGYVPPADEHKPTNLVFLIDTSGSMSDADKLPLLQRSFALLVDQLDPSDTVSIVTYAGSAGVVLEPTKASDRTKILGALDQLHAGGSTAGGEGIELAYRVAEQNKIAGGNNRVILATDGDFNVGISDPTQLIDYIKTKRDAGISLSVLGFGRGNLDDATMQALAQNGNGNAAYIDSFKEARKVLVEQAGATLEMIAKDVKIQVEFNPAFVSEYRLIGYETRALNREDFNNDKVDAGDIGAGHTVTAIYEITPTGSGAELIDPLHFGNGTTPATPAATTPTDEIAFLKMRYKLPDGDTSKLLELPITRDMAVDDIAKVSDDLRFAAAVAAFGQKLKGSNYGGEMSYEQIRQLAQGAKGSDEDGYRAEFVQLVTMAASVSGGNGASPTAVPDGN